MLAYQVCECTRSVPAQASAIARSTPRVRSAALADGQLGRVGVRRRQLLVARGTERVHLRLDVGAGAQRPDQLGDVHARAAVDLGWVLPGQHVDSHVRKLPAVTTQAYLRGVPQTPRH